MLTPRTVGLATRQRNATIEARVQPFAGGLLLSAPLHSPAKEVLAAFFCAGNEALISFKEGSGPFEFVSFLFYHEGETKRGGLAVRPLLAARYSRLPELRDVAQALASLTAEAAVAA